MPSLPILPVQIKGQRESLGKTGIETDSMYMQLKEQEEQLNAGIAPYSASYKRVLIKTVLDDADGPQHLVGV